MGDLIAFMSIPNGRINEPCVGFMATTRPLTQATDLLVTLENDVDDGNIVVTQVPGDARFWTIEITPLRTGVITVHSFVTAAGQLESRDVTFLAVGEGQQIPSGGPPRSRIVTPFLSSYYLRYYNVDVATPPGIAHPSVGFLVSTPDGGCWAGGDGQIRRYAPNGYEVASIGYDGTTRADTHVNRAQTDDENSLYFIGEFDRLWTPGVSGTSIGESPVPAGCQVVLDMPSANSYWETTLCKLRADGTVAWARTIGPATAGHLVMSGSALYFITTKWIGSERHVVIESINRYTGASISSRNWTLKNTYSIVDAVAAAGGRVALICLSKDGGKLYNGTVVKPNEAWLVVHNADISTYALTRLSSDYYKASPQKICFDAATGHYLVAYRTVYEYSPGVTTPVQGLSGGVTVPLPYMENSSLTILRMDSIMQNAEVIARYWDNPESLDQYHGGYFYGNLHPVFGRLWPKTMSVIQPGVVALAGFEQNGSILKAVVVTFRPNMQPTKAYAPGVTITTLGSGTAYSTVAKKLAPRRDGGAWVLIDPQQGQSPFRIAYSPDPANEPTVVDNRPSIDPLGRMVLATVDLNGQWSAPGDAPLPLPEPSDPFPILPYPTPAPTPEPGQASTPGPPGPAALPAFPEDQFLITALSWGDHDPQYTPDLDYTFEVAASPSGPWTTSQLTLPNVHILVAEDARDARERWCGLVVIPNANWHGTYTFYARVRKANYPNDLISTVATIAGTVTPVADDPSAPYPTTMPSAAFRESVVGRFTFTDPDGSPWQPLVSATGATWGSTCTIPGKGTLTVVDADHADQAFTVRWDPMSTFTSGTYEFLLKVVDSGGDESPAAAVTGVVEGPAVTVTLQRVNVVTNGTPTIEPLTVLTDFTNLSVTEALDGPGAANFEITVGELKRRAEALNLRPYELITPNVIEVFVAIEGTPIFAGPITDVRHDFYGETVSINAKGLLGYLENRTIETLTTPLEFTGVEQSSIIWQLIHGTQMRNSGSLALTNQTTDTGQTRLISFDPGTTIAAAISELCDKLNGAEVWITPNREVRTAIVRGIDRRGEVVLTPDACSRFEVKVDARNLANVVEVHGDGVAKIVAAGDWLGYGRLVRALDANQLTDEASCTAVANTYVDQLKEMPVYYTVTHAASPGRPVSVLDYGVGDAITLEDASGMVFDLTGNSVTSDDVRIVSRTIRLVNGTSSSYEIDLEVERVGSDGVIRGSHSDHNPELVSQVYDALYRR